MRALPLLLSLTLASPLSAQDAAFPAQTFSLDPSHATLIFSVGHLGFSNFTANFDTFEGTLTLDPAAPQDAALSVTINVSSLDLPTPPLGFKEELLGPNFFDVDRFPQITFDSTAVTLTGERTADVTGDLTLRGVTRPMTLAVTFNGNSEAGQFEPWVRAGFSARGELSRSAFGMDYGVPPEGSTLGVFDRVSVLIETEWTGEDTTQ